MDKINNNYQQLKTQSLGSEGINGFIGKYNITPTSITKFNEDQWCKGTVYDFAHFESSREDFYTKSLNVLMQVAPGDIFTKMKNVKNEGCYVPMLVTESGQLICLHSQNPQLSYNFFEEGYCNRKQIDEIFSNLEEFDPHKIDAKSFHFLSIWLSLNDAAYVANIFGGKIDLSATPKVLLIPIHTLKFEYDGFEYSFMSYGDKLMSNFIYNSLPIDEYFCNEKQVYNYPYITVSLITLFFIGIVGCTMFTCYKLWNVWEMFFLYKLVIFCIPIALVYLLALVALSMLRTLLRFTTAKLERVTSLLIQQKYINNNISQKLKYLKMHMGEYTIDRPSIKYKYSQTKEIENRANAFLNGLSLAEVKKIIDNIL